MTRITRRWFRSALLLMLALSAQVPACEYGQNPNGRDAAVQPAMQSDAPPAPPTVPV